MQRLLYTVKEAGVAPPASLFISHPNNCGSDIRFPESVQVAILISRYGIRCLED